MYNRSLFDNSPLFFSLLLIGTAGALLTSIFLVGWGNLFFKVLETSPPIIKILSAPPGLGITPSELSVVVYDTGAGLAEFSVQLEQAGKTQTILENKNLLGAPSTEIMLDFLGSESGLREGKATLAVTAKDRSLIGNLGQTRLVMGVDFDAPKLTLFDYDAEILQGSTQLLFVRASDNQPSVEVGLSVGREVFRAFPAKALDRYLEDPNLLVIPWVAPIGSPVESLKPTVFVEDSVGNGKSEALNISIVERAPISESTEINSTFLREEIRDIVQANEKTVQEVLKAGGETLNYLTAENSEERDREYFTVLNKLVTPIQERIFRKKLSSPRFDRYWFKPLVRQDSRVLSRFSAVRNFNLNGSTIGASSANGYTLGLPRGIDSVVSVSDGIVIFSDYCGHLGRCLAIDHGLGLVSVYGQLSSTTVAVGAKITGGQPIGVGTRNSLGPFHKFYLELRLQGVPVEIRDWWDAGWFAKKISGSINQVKKELNIPTAVFGNY